MIDLPRAFVLLLAALPALAAPCEQLLSLSLPHATVTAAESITSGSFTPPAASPLAGLPPFCRVAVTLKPSTDSDIRIEVWLPQSGWNGRFEGTGNGGFAGKISYGALASGVKRNYAVANTDMGLAVPAGSDASIFTARPERWTDWGSRATHEMTLAAKQVIHSFYGRDPGHSYFVGCSTGGQQGLMEAQRFPDDYDGIVAGAAAHQRTGVHTSILWNFAATQRNEASYIPAAKLALLAKAALSSCDAQDGLRDGLIIDPRRCRFDPAALQCKSPVVDACLTPAQVDTARRIYQGPVNPRTKEQIYPGMPVGTETNWTRFGPMPDATPAPVPYAPIFQWVFGRDWNWRSFDFDGDYARLNTTLAAKLNATDPDLSVFHKRGHKLITYHGWSDWLVVPGESIAYHDAVSRRMGKTGDFFRLFMVPGMEHCSGGPGPNNLDPLTAMVDWVERGKAPEKLIGTKYVNDKAPEGIAFQRPLCPYPQQARYRGTGSPKDAGSFTCSEPTHAH